MNKNETYLLEDENQGKLISFERIRKNLILFFTFTLLPTNVYSGENLSLVCDGTTTINIYPVFSSQKYKDIRTFIFENGKLKSELSYKCQWNSNQIMCSNKPGDLSYVSVDRLSGVIHRMSRVEMDQAKFSTIEFTGDCKLAKQKF